MKTATKRLLGSIIAVIILALLSLAFLFGRGIIKFNKPDASYPLGIDVSSYQGSIDWDKLASQNISFAFIKATEGSMYFDECCAENLKNAKKTNLLIGAYHFFSYDSPGVYQAINFTSMVVPDDLSLPPVVDIELYNDYKSKPQSAEKVVPELTALLNELEGYTGRKPIIYASAETYELYIRDNFKDYPLWLRSVYSEPGVDCDFWQYSDRGRLEGYSGSEYFIDLNVFCGTYDELLALSQT